MTDQFHLCGPIQLPSTMTLLYDSRQEWRPSMADNESQREVERRRHKLLGSYLAFWAWRNKVDCVVLPHEQLLSYLGLNHMKHSRVDWLRDDLTKLFPYPWITINDATKRYTALYLSRVPIPKKAQNGYMNAMSRVQMMRLAGLRAAIAKIPKDSDIVRSLALIAHGMWG